MTKFLHVTVYLSLFGILIVSLVNADESRHVSVQLSGGITPGTQNEAEASLPDVRSGSIKPLTQKRKSSDANMPINDAAYRIGVGDVLLISIWKDDSLTHQVSVLPDGKISFPLIGEVYVKDLTIAELKAIFSNKIARYIPDATVSVQMVQLNSLVIYIIGKVNGPGRFMLHDNINVLQALAMAGGLNSFAKSSRIRIFRETAQGTRILLFDYDEVSKGKHLEQNLKLERGDVIVVP